MGHDPGRFASLVQAFVNGPYRVTQHAAGPISHVVQTYPQLLAPHYCTILRKAQEAGAHPAVRRNVMRLLQFVAIPPKHQPAVMNLAFALFTNRAEPIAVRVFAMTVLADLAKRYPELKNELIPLLEDEAPVGTPAFRSRALKILSDFQMQLNPEW